MGFKQALKRECQMSSTFAFFGGCPKMMSLRPIVFTISRHETMGRMMRNHGCVSPVYGDIRPKKTLGKTMVGFGTCKPINY